jgi:hypothetical protein
LNLLLANLYNNHLPIKVLQSTSFFTSSKTPFATWRMHFARSDSGLP